MAQQHYITSAQAQQAMASPLGTKQTDYYRRHREGYFFDYVKSELIKTYGIDAVRKGGLRVYTTINLKWQRIARAAIAKNLSVPGDPSAALVSIDPSNGHILAMASSARYGTSKFNLAAQSHRQAGSTFKVMTLMAAIRRGVDPKTTTYVSKPLDFFDKETGTQIKVQTDDHRYVGRTNLFEALVRSDNTVYQQLDLDIGPKNVTKTAHDMGITSHLDSYPAEGLGGMRIGVSPLEMAQRLRDDRLRRLPQPRRRDHEGDPVRRQGGHQALGAASHEGLHRRADDGGDRGDGGQRVARHRHALAVRLHLGRRQDRHDLELHRRMVRRDGPGPRDRGLGRLPERHDVDDRGARLGRDVRRPGADRDLARLHVDGRQETASRGRRRRTRSSPSRSSAATRRARRRRATGPTTATPAAPATSRPQQTTPAATTGTTGRRRGGQKYPPDQYASPRAARAADTTPPVGRGGGTAAPQGGGNGDGTG